MLRLSFILPCYNVALYIGSFPYLFQCKDGFVHGKYGMKVA